MSNYFTTEATKILGPRLEAGVYEVTLTNISSGSYAATEKSPNGGSFERITIQTVDGRQETFATFDTWTDTFMSGICTQWSQILSKAELGKMLLTDKKTFKAYLSTSVSESTGEIYRNWSSLPNNPAPNNASSNSTTKAKAKSSKIAGII